MLRVILNNWMQHLTKQQLYNHLPPITRTIPIRRIRYVGEERIHKHRFLIDSITQTQVQTLIYKMATLNC